MIHVIDLGKGVGTAHVGETTIDFYSWREEKVLTVPRSEFPNAHVDSLTWVMRAYNKGHNSGLREAERDAADAYREGFDSGQATPRWGDY